MPAACSCDAGADGWTPTNAEDVAQTVASTKSLAMLAVEDRGGSVKDFRANAAKARRHAAPSLADSLRAENRAHKPGGVLEDPSVAVGFLWLRRTLAFQVGINRYALAADGPVALAAAAKRAYADELEPVHGWLLRGVFGAALNNVPAWDAYLVAVAPQVPAEYRHAVVRRDLEAFNAALVPLLAAWKQLFIDLDLEDVRRV